jgi:hypothetical protein
MIHSDLTHERLRERLFYDAGTGLFVWLVNIRVDGRLYQAHRLAWFYVHGKWPDGQIDHIDGNRKNNRIANLRDVPNRTNCQNRHRPPKSNRTSGLIGVSRHSQNNKWVASACLNGKSKYLGSYDSADAANAVAVEFRRTHYQGYVL